MTPLNIRISDVAFKDVFTLKFKHERTLLQGSSLEPVQDLNFRMCIQLWLLIKNWVYFFISLTKVITIADKNWIEFQRILVNFKLIKEGIKLETVKSILKIILRIRISQSLVAQGSVDNFGMRYEKQWRLDAQPEVWILNWL